MKSILLIADGATATAAVESALTTEPVLIARAHCVNDAEMLISHAPFDLVVCAIDDLTAPARECLRYLEELTEMPTVVAVSDPSLPIRATDAQNDVVTTHYGIEPLQQVIRQRLEDKTPASGTFATPTCRFSFEIGADPNQIAHSRTIATAFIQRCIEISNDELLRVELVIEEMLSNAIYHGCLDVAPSLRNRDAARFHQLLNQRMAAPHYGERQVSVEVELTESELRISVEDEGSGFDTSSAMDPSRRSTRGMLLLHAFADRVEFNEAGNRVTLARIRSEIEQPAEAEPIESKPGLIERAAETLRSLASTR